MANESKRNKANRVKMVFLLASVAHSELGTLIKLDIEPRSVEISRFDVYVNYQFLLNDYKAKVIELILLQLAQ